MSIRLRYQLTLVEPISLRVAPGRGGNTFIPGANILGAVAARGGYARAQALGLEWDLFHSGAVSFGDARQLDERAQAPVIATPLSVHQPKRSAGGDYRDLTLIPPAARFRRDESPTQLVQTRGVIGASGRAPLLKSGYALKTAIDVKSQRADDGKLFGHSYIASGAELGCAILIDGAHPRAAELTEFIKGALAQGLRLGKSRSAEFGEVRATLIEEASRHWSESEPSASKRRLPRYPHPEDSGREVVSYCLFSDNDTVDDRFDLKVDDLGLSAKRFRIEPSYAFTRAVFWREFQGYRDHPIERVITISATSVDWENVSEYDKSHFDVLESKIRAKVTQSRNSVELQVACVKEITQHWSESEPSASSATLRRRPHPEDSGREVVSYLLLSDTCLADHISGEPTLNVDAAHLGLDSSRFCVEPDYTFTRVARWRQFNGHRRRPDVERVALVAGSVITVSADPADWDALDTQAHLSTLSAGLGAHTAEGLGRVSASHPFVGDDAELNARYAASGAEIGNHRGSATSGELPAPPSDELGRWMAQRYERSLYEEVALTLARELTQRSQDKTVTASEGIWSYSFDQLLKGGSSRPSSSQWRAVEHEARKLLHKTNGLSHLRAHLIEDREALLVRGKAKDVWRLEAGASGEAPSQGECRRTPGLCVVAILSEDLYYREGEATSDWLTQLEEATELRLRSTRSAVTREGVQRLVVDHLAPLTLVHFARAVARKIQS